MHQDTHSTVTGIIEQMRGAINNPQRFEALSDELQVLTAAYTLPTVGSQWDEYRLTKQMRRIADLLFSKIGKTVSTTAMMNAVYFDRAGDEPADKIIQIRICQMREKLSGSNLAIETIRGQGYRMVEKV